MTPTPTNRDPGETPFPAAETRFAISGGIGKARCEPGWNWRPPPLPDYDLWYALSGQGEMRINGATYPIRRGSCFLIRPDDCPQAEQDPEDRLRVIFIHFDILHPTEARRVTPALLPERHLAIPEPHTFEPLLERVVELIEYPEEWFREEFDLLMKQIFLRLHREELEGKRRRDPELSTLRKQQRLVGQVTARLRDNPGLRLTHAELAAEVGLSPEYLNRLFKKLTGLSLKETMTKIRLERARLLLRETSMNVTQVADSLGYANVYLFSKQFKDHFGMPPSKMRWRGVLPKPHGGRSGRSKPPSE